MNVYVSGGCWLLNLTEDQIGAISLISERVRDDSWNKIVFDLEHGQLRKYAECVYAPKVLSAELYRMSVEGLHVAPVVWVPNHKEASIFVYDNNMHVEAMVRFIRLLAVHVKLTQNSFAVTWGVSDDSGIPSEFGGGACAFTLANEKWMNSHDFARNNMAGLIDGTDSRLCMKCQSKLRHDSYIVMDGKVYVYATCQDCGTLEELIFTYEKRKAI